MTIGKKIGPIFWYVGRSAVQWRKSQCVYCWCIAVKVD